MIFLKLQNTDKDDDRSFTLLCQLEHQIQALDDSGNRQKCLRLLPSL